jgi:hypothetical protein
LFYEAGARVGVEIYAEEMSFYKEMLVSETKECIVPFCSTWLMGGLCIVDRYRCSH